MSLSCNEVRLRLPLDEPEPDEHLEEHLRCCSACQRLAGWHQRFDTLLRTELTVMAPEELTSRLVALVPAALAGLPIRSRRWYRQRLIAALVASILVSISVLVLAVGLNWAAQRIGLPQMLATVSLWPSLAIQYLYIWLPQSQVVVETALRLREPLQWLIVALLLWRAFDRMRPSQELGSA